MTTQLPFASFGSLAQGIQVGQNYGPINAEFHLPTELPETPPRPFAVIPFSPDRDFVNRGDILSQIHERCSEPATRVALVGLGGVGKSQLAIEYAYRVAEEKDIWVFWVHAGTHARVEEGFRAIADAIKLPGRNQPKADIPQLVYNWLSNERNGRWFIVLDSADDGDVFYKAGGRGPDKKSLVTYLPQSRNGCIFATTRDRGLARRLTGGHKNVIEVGLMVEADAISLLEKKIGPLSDRDTAGKLVAALDYVPLAISQAAGYIQARSPRSTLKKYLSDFREGERKRVRLLGYDGGDLRRDGSASNSVVTTWQMSFEHIRSKRPSAADLLSLMSFFDNQGIPEALLKPVKEEGAPRATSIYESDDSESSGSDGESGDDFEDDIAMLSDFCLVRMNEGGDVFEMHRLVQLSTRKWLAACGQQMTFKEQFVSRMAASFPIGDYSNWAICQSLFAHVEVAMDCRPAEPKVEEAWATLLYNGGWYAWLQGNYDVAERMVHKTRSSYERRVGGEDMDALASMSLLALILLDKGSWEEAEKLFVQVIETSKTKLGPDHPDTLTSMVNLASTYGKQGRWEEAEKLEVQVIETSKTKLGPDHPDTLTSMANLALTFWNQGWWEEAEKLFVQVIETRKAKLGLNHLDTLTSMANLASTYRSRGRWEEAEKLEVQVIETSKTKLGADHPDTLTSMYNLAFTWHEMGRYEDASSLIQVCSTLQHRRLGPDHPYIVSTL